MKSGVLVNLKSEKQMNLCTGEGLVVEVDEDKVVTRAFPIITWEELG